MSANKYIEDLLLKVCKEEGVLPADALPLGETRGGDRSPIQEAGAVFTNEVSVRALVEQIAESNRRFDILRAEAIVDRQRSDQRFNAQIAEIRAQSEQIRALLSALATTNGRVDTLEQAS